MCGILAVVGDFRYDKIPDALIERGRDGQGVYEDEHVQLIQTRLQITGNDEMKLPVQTDTWVLLFNGEIYNYKLLNKLYLYMYDFKYDSDFETVLYGFEKYGYSFINMLDGQFAIFLYNKKTQQHHFFRDELAIRTVYKMEYQDSTIYSSNLRSLPAIKFNKFPTRGYGNVTNAIEL